ncbi:hypothetical protein Hanom_Chr09g00776731 [Helianthus anomalus]
MSLPLWDVEELPKVRTLSYPVREHDMPTWGLMKFEAFRDFKHWKPHYPKKVKRVDPVRGFEETIMQIKKPRVLKNIPLSKMEQNFREGFICWVYSCIATKQSLNTELVKRLETFTRMILSEDREQALQFQKVDTICFQKGINSVTMWLSHWRAIEKEEAMKAKKKKEEQEEKDKIYIYTCMQRLAEEEKRATAENESSGKRCGGSQSQEKKS